MLFPSVSEHPIPTPSFSSHSQCLIFRSLCTTSLSNHLYMKTLTKTFPSFQSSRQQYISLPS
ncbi:hypothetical protein K435DRAFT_78770 [Dendrothele bispora CBS 962.96]|uniref:Uncharacterized protein n=1 Tax=Dendrothele bispora (strain CBS 962.96) TaxID=1314807 RepID=A0A4S8M451_DENBC|nr:hypothetical protein K435DRAFT_78770 [Dendrothele bispora CBS 962.96]